MRAHLGDAAAARPRQPRPRGGRVLPLQARRHPGGRLREPPVRAARDPAQRRRALSRAASPTRSSGSVDLLAHHFWHERRRDREAALPAPRRARRRRRPTRTLRRSTTTSGSRRCSRRRERVDVLLELGRCSSSSASGSAPERSRRSALELAEASGDDARAGLVRSGARRGRRASRTASTRRAERLARAAARVRGARRGRGPRPGPAPRRHARRPARRLRRGARALRGRASRSAAASATGKMMASLLSNLGVVAEYEGDYALARSFHEQALELRTRARRPLGDRGLDDQPRHDRLARGATTTRRASRFEEAMRLNREVGDSWMVAISHNNLGNANRGLGDYAAARRALRREPARAPRATTTSGRSRSCSRTSAPRRARPATRELGARAARRRRRAARGDRRPAHGSARAGDRRGDRTGRCRVEPAAAGRGARSWAQARSRAGDRGRPRARRLRMSTLARRVDKHPGGSFRKRARSVSFHRS